MSRWPFPHENIKAVPQPVAQPEKRQNRIVTKTIQGRATIGCEKRARLVSCCFSPDH